MRRVVYGAMAGFCATMVMTAAMRTLHERLPMTDRYPLPPREITERALPAIGGDRALTAMLAHFGFGAFAGAIYGLLPRRMPGLVYGPLVWAASYLGWIPGAGILVPATRHPPTRNLLMLAVHLVWGASLAKGVEELETASARAFARGRIADAAHDPRRMIGDMVDGR